MKKIGYARVSTRDQNLEMQIQAIKKAGCDKIYQEKKSGRKIEDRSVLKKLLKQFTPGDTLVVWKIDRLGRSAKELLEVLEILRRKNVIIISLREGIDTSFMLGKFLFMIAGIFAEMEINGRSERTREGIRIAKLKGKKLGRPPGISISLDKLNLIMELRKNGGSVKEISLKTGVPVSSLYRYIRLNS